MAGRPPLPSPIHSSLPLPSLNASSSPINSVWTASGSSPIHKKGWTSPSRRKKSDANNNSAEHLLIDSTKCFIHNLPNEIVIHILANLDAMDLGSWRREYLTRTGLLKEWGKGRQSIQFEPRVGKIEQALMDWQTGLLYAGSLEKGMIALCHPFTGKVDKEAIFCGDEDRVPVQVGVIKIDKQRIVIGQLTGQLSLITNFKDRMDYSVKRFHGFHDGPVTCIAWLSHFPGVILSGGVDGTVKVWDANTAKCLKNLTAGLRKRINYIAFDPKYYVLASTEDGHVHVWDLHISELCEKSQESNNEEQQQIQSLLASRVFPNPVGTAILNHLIYEPETQTCLTIYQASSDQGVKRLRVENGLIVNQFSNAHRVEVTCATWDRLVSGKTEKNTSILVTGDKLGSICIWEVPDHKSDASIIHPLRTISCAHDAPLTQLYLDPFKIVSVDVSGVIRVWDLMTTRCIRGLNEIRHNRHYEQSVQEEINEQRRIHLVCVGPYQIISAIGNSMKSWNFDPFYLNQAHGKKKKHRTLGNSHSRSAGGQRPNIRQETRSPRQQFLIEMREEISRVTEDREFDRINNEIQSRQSIKFNGQPGSMTEQEMMNYAMMLSLEENQPLSSQQASLDVLRSPPSGAPSPSPRSSNILSRSPRHYNASSSRRDSWQERFRNDEWDDEDDDYDPETAMYYSSGSRGTSLELDIDSELSTSIGKRRLFYGASANSKRSNDYTNETPNSRYASGAAGILLRSPGLVPVTPHQGNVMTAHRPGSSTSAGWDDEELQYVLEMSLVDK